ncbi:MAG TPA: DUF58 domain-containing protein [Myxococcaceae bacterium]|nr:DUF58 domain-containing protein [Myxococcaceae bacterium]
MTSGKRPYWERLRRLLRPPRTLKVTRSGRIFLAITVGVDLGALNTGNNLLFLLLGLMLSTIVVSGVMSERCLRHLHLERLPASTAFAGEPFTLRWSIVGSGGPAFALSLSEAGSGLAAEGTCAYLPAGEERVVRARAIAPRRGPVAFHGIRVTTEFPLGLFAKSRLFPLPGTLLVFPKRSAVVGRALPARREAIGDQGSNHLLEGSGDFVDFRELGAGEDARRVHWKKSAAAGKLLRTIREREEHSTYLLRIPSHLRADALERECETAAAAAHRLLKQGHDVGLETARTRIAPAQGPRQEWQILCALAWAGFETGADL